MNNYAIKIKILLEPIYQDAAPHIIYGIDTNILSQQSICYAQEIVINSKLSRGSHRFFLELVNKDHAANKKDRDMHIKIKHIGFQDMEENFHYFSKYRPVYPTQWLQQQKEMGKEWPETILSNHMGWNGTYYIDFETPIYKWIHKKLNLGWLI
jgi:hypothetical protein